MSEADSDPSSYWDTLDIVTDYFPYQPKYTEVVVPWIFDYYREKNPEWKTSSKIPLIVNVGCGSAQLIDKLSRFCTHMIAIGNTPSQMQKALQMNQRPNISYNLFNPLQLTGMCADNSVDIIVVGQAIHLFDCNAFYRQVKRCLKTNGVFAVIGYTCPGIYYRDRGRDTIFRDFLVPTESLDDQKVRDFYRILHVPCDNYRRMETQIAEYMTRAEIKGMLRSDRRWRSCFSDIVAVSALPIEALFKLVLDVFAIFTVGKALTPKEKV